MTAAPVDCRRFPSLRGVRWRINLGILPSSESASVEDLRRVAADCRRSYASLRRRLLIDPHFTKDGHRSSDPAVDNPLSQNPESMWGRFFRNAELEKMVDQDLSRLYPEDGSYFQTPACQTMLRRILSLWCLRHPECGYRQGMHELLAPLVYVLHVDLDYLSQVRGLYEDCFNDEFDVLPYQDNDLVSNNRTSKDKSWDVGVNGNDFYHNSGSKMTCIDDLDPDSRDVFLLSDAYGAEGELGVVISERFMEHDAYCMFDGLMTGAHGVVAMADFFSISPATSSSMSLSPVIEASSALYHLLAVIDSSLHSHLVELGVEPQYFALRWLRVLFGREFFLNDLLLIWDELFSSPNDSSMKNEEYSFKILCSPRGTFISAIAVSMLLHMRSSLLATENATSCLQRLLNFPRNIDVKKVIEKARSFQVLASEMNVSTSSHSSSTKSTVLSVNRASSESPKTPTRVLPDSYWEEKWRVLHKDEDAQKNDLGKGGRIKKLLRGKFRLSRTESDPSPTKIASGKRQACSSVRRMLLDDLKSEGNSIQHTSPIDESSLNDDIGKDFPQERGDQKIIMASEHVNEEECSTTENSSEFSVPSNPNNEGNDHDIESEESSVTSDSLIGDNEDVDNCTEECNNNINDPATNEYEVHALSDKLHQNVDVEVKNLPEVKKSLSGKFQWFWKFAKGDSAEGNLEKGTNAEARRTSSMANGKIHQETLENSIFEHSCYSDCARIEAGDKNIIGTLKNLGHTMLDNIQVIESVFQQERGQASNILGGKGQATAMAALKELRKISNLLSEM
ncbi:hypothetical protein AXF42_Ash012405 [Apostasia shenzhenica]|uniref:Rab-GAP TBC domain-containing protein n=1 Tax=Apostasia shenzhenica TaxID=1088818 RepID=A0A2I0AQW5_9ASPA|nr:hypothetical protein AXF42_Ash012405 [Apostasia shenzhenica]